MPAFELTPKQKEAQKLFSGTATHICLFGGSRSGKTSLIVRNIILRAIKSPGSRHGIFRYRYNSIKSSIILDTFPKIFDLAFPEVKYNLNKSDSYAELDNGSQIWFGGLDEKERTEKILGMEFATIYLNECSQIPWDSRNLLLTRLAQLSMMVIDSKTQSPLPLRAYYDCNPPSKSHWTYKTFVLKQDVDTKKPLKNPDYYASMRINPVDNLDNLNSEYLRSLESLPARQRLRFLAGEFADSNPNALFSQEVIDTWRVTDGATPQLLRVIVAVDPSGANGDNPDADAIGIMVVGLGIDGNCYVLEDCTLTAGPKIWGAVATSAYDRHEANMIVGEINFGGAMVERVIQTSRPGTPYQSVTASRGKSVRADPISALYEQGRVRHVGHYPGLEDELCAFCSFGYIGQNSPNRADALVWAITALFPGIVSPTKTTQIDYSAFDKAFL